MTNTDTHQTPAGRQASSQNDLPSTPETSSTHHHLVIDPRFGEPTLKLECTAPPGAPCRRRPPRDDWRDTWHYTDPNLIDADCWAVEYINAAGWGDAVTCDPDAAFPRIPIHIHYDDGVWITPTNTQEDA